MNLRNVAILLFDQVEVLDFAGPFEEFAVAASVNTSSQSISNSGNRPDARVPVVG